MPGCRRHDHDWPAAGALTICGGERTCGYCVGTAAQHNYNRAYALRQHVYKKHTDGGRRDYAGVELKGYQEPPSQQQRRERSSSRTSSGSRTRSTNGRYTPSQHDETPSATARGRPRGRSATPGPAPERGRGKTRSSSRTNNAQPHGDTDMPDVDADAERADADAGIDPAITAIIADAIADNITVARRPPIKLNLRRRGGNIPAAATPTATLDGGRTPRHVSLHPAAKANRGNPVVDEHGDTEEDILRLIALKRKETEAAQAMVQAKRLRREYEQDVLDQRLARVRKMKAGTADEFYGTLN